ncbi:hypothetical protein [Dehalogenimonas etheniformans]|uniref:Uncharacterized protein n=1 Tax=Dehalogenimonas etheniformans TaxID=1536648 RepID=A0A2P5P5L8_9CHLR|nr:hypothetical protein [Dehalogenimonas etheniformans]PPD57584.1 hypothetical protein JP09_007500 [Dehalogenimonas etheniformans]QNT75923.1 hypothetical protein HX448_04080 [Dehalogenimonas etheniformans]
MRENIFSRVTQSIAYVAVGGALVVASDQTYGAFALLAGLIFIVIGFLVAISTAFDYIPRWIIGVETVTSVALYIAVVAALIKVGIIDTVSDNKALIIIMFVFIIMIPAIQAIRILRSPR